MAEIDAKDNGAEAIEEEPRIPQGDAAEAEEAEGEEVDREEATLEELAEVKAKADEYLDGWRRAQAEFANYKKRQRAEQAKTRERANADLLRKLLPVLDDFDRAIITMPDSLRHLSWIQGLLMIERKLEVILDTEGVEAIDAQGETFDPNYHEAVTHEEMPGYEEGQIIGEVQKGYTLGERVLRPALVRVAKAPPASAEEGDDASGEGEE